MSDSNSTALSPMVQIDFSQLGADVESLAIKEHAFLGQVNLRGATDNSNFMRAARKALGDDLPVEPNTFVEKNDNTVLWLGPNEWIILTAGGRVANLVAKLEAELKDVFSAVTDVTGGSTVLELSGAKAQSLLLKGCPLDLHHSVFSVGQCAQTVIAKTSMTLWCVDDTPIYKLIVRRSFADYLGYWLLDAAREYKN